jgi:hypothetical protein
VTGPTAWPPCSHNLPLFYFCFKVPVKKRSSFVKNFDSFPRWDFPCQVTYRSNIWHLWNTSSRQDSSGISFRFIM